MRRRPLVALGMLGTQLDGKGGPRGDKRWSVWRPSVALCGHEDLLIDRFELLHPTAHTRLAELVQADLAQVSPETEVRLVPFELRDPWDFEGVYAALHDFARGYAFAPEREDYLVHLTTGTHVAQICLFLLTESRHLPARLIQTSPPVGADREDRVGALHGSYQIIDLDLSRYDLLATRFAGERREGQSTLKAGIATRSPTFNALIAQVERVAGASRAPILLTGPTGAGKSQLARRIHLLKRARNQVSGPLVEVNCATLRGDGAMSALFGHVKGAFTGAQAARAGLLREADGGVLFLDEIGELGLDEQAMLLRAIEDRRFLPVGADREVTSDFQLLAGTNRDLGGQVQAGVFREDLLARINLWHFQLPGLRERLADLEPNLDFEVERATATLGTRITLSKEAREAFLAFATGPEGRWPGNFRDLNAAVTRMATLAPGGRIDEDTVAEEVDRLRTGWRGLGALTASEVLGPAARETASILSENSGLALTGRVDADTDAVAAVLGGGADALDLFDRVQLAEVLRVCAEHPSLSAAGRHLFAQSRARKANPNDADRLRKYLARFGLAFVAGGGVEALSGAG